MIADINVDVTADDDDNVEKLSVINDKNAAGYTDVDYKGAVVDETVENVTADDGDWSVTDGDNKGDVIDETGVDVTADDEDLSIYNG